MNLTANDEQFKVAYVDKATLRNLQVWPVPDDLENWYEVEFDPKFVYRGKVYDPETKTWADCAVRKRAMAISSRKRAYREESDHLFMEYQFDGTDEAKQRWMDAVKSIKERFPLD